MKKLHKSLIIFCFVFPTNCGEDCEYFGASYDSHGICVYDREGLVNPEVVRDITKLTKEYFGITSFRLEHTLRLQRKKPKLDGIEKEGVATCYEAFVYVGEGVRCILSTALGHEIAHMISCEQNSEIIFDKTIDTEEEEQRKLPKVEIVACDANNAVNSVLKTKYCP